MCLIKHNPIKIHVKVEVLLNAFITSALMEVSFQLHAPAFLPSVSQWVGPRTGLDTVEKRRIPFPAPASNRTLVVQPAA